MKIDYFHSGFAGAPIKSPFNLPLSKLLLFSCRWTIMYNPALYRGRSSFALIYPHVEPKLSCKQRYLDIIVMVNTAAHSEKHRNLRSSIRQTWANSSSFNNRDSNGTWMVFFSIGLSNQADDTLNEQEADKNNDIIIGNFTDTYRNIPIKTFMSHLWAYSQFDFTYILKTDDDVYVRVPVLHQWLMDNASSRRFYGGYINRNPIVFRHPGSPWYITYEQFNETKWPDFCHGAFQVLTIDLLPAYLYYTQVLSLVRMYACERLQSSDIKLGQKLIRGLKRVAWFYAQKYSRLIK